jgi:predicted aminopeptidase
LIDRTAHTLKRFTRHVEARDFGDEADRQQLKKHDDDAARREALEDQAKRKELGRLVARMRDRLEAEYQATLRAKKLYAAQRQQCPPKYRHVVNKYYEKLAEMSK